MRSRAGFCGEIFPLRPRLSCSGLGISSPELACVSSRERNRQGPGGRDVPRFLPKKDHDKTIPSSSLGHESWSPGQRGKKNVVSIVKKMFKKKIKLQGHLDDSVSRASDS